MWSRARRLAAFALAAAVLAPTIARPQDARTLVERAETYVDAGRYADAESSLVRASRISRGDDRQRALFELGRLKQSADEATALFQRVIDEDPTSDWAKRATLEIAEIQYALGNYQNAYRLLNDAGACRVSDEACLFTGLSAIMSKHYRQAKDPLTHINRGKYRMWAYLMLAEADAGLDDTDGACRRYESLATAMLSPTAIYRYAECLEEKGREDEAKARYRELIKNFPETPEAVQAASKIEKIGEPRAPAGGGQAPPATAANPQGGEEEHAAPLKSGFTIQFGSFRDRGNAIKLAAKIKRVYPAVRIDTELVRYREYHRVRYGYFRTREEAQRKAEEISKQVGEDYTIMSLP